jgi:hypothetical protein
MDRLRAKEARMQLVVDGERQQGSFLKISNFTLNPRQEKIHTRFTGDKRERNDLRVDGWDFSFQIQEVDSDWYIVWKLFEDAEKNGSPYPVVTAIVTKNFRTKPSFRIKMFGEVLITPDGNPHNEHDHTSVDWTGSARFAEPA